MSNNNQNNNPPKQQSNAEVIKEAVKEALEQALPTAVGVAVNIMKGPQAQAAAPPKHEFPSGRCQKCRQNIRTCKDKHRLAMVFPKSEMFFDLFQGIFINGVCYNSGVPGHRIWVPAESSIEYDVAQWEEREVINAKGRSKKRKSMQVNMDTGERSLNNEPVGFDV